MTCEAGSDGCPQWSPATPCPSSAPACSNGACAATCSDECMMGQAECDTASSVRTCGQFDGDPCLDWSPPTQCPTGQECSNGACAAPTCSMEGASCDDGSACTVDDTCAQGTCSGTPKCTSAPANATPTCAIDGTCGFACNTGYTVDGSGCAVSDSIVLTMVNDEPLPISNLYLETGSDTNEDADVLGGVPLDSGDVITVEFACTMPYSFEVVTPVMSCRSAVISCSTLEIDLDDVFFASCQ